MSIKNFCGLWLEMNGDHLAGERRDRNRRELWRRMQQDTLPLNIGSRLVRAGHQAPDNGSGVLPILIED